jgi:hypothetical protein
MIEVSWLSFQQGGGGGVMNGLPIESRTMDLSLQASAYLDLTHNVPVGYLAISTRLTFF